MRNLYQNQLKRLKSRNKTWEIANLLYGKHAISKTFLSAAL